MADLHRAPEPHDVRAFAGLLRDAQQAVRGAERAALEPFGIAGSTFRLLDLLGRDGPCGPAAAAAALGVSRPSITAWVNDLVAMELVDRAGLATDGRRARVALTDEGERVWRAASDAVRRRQNRLLAVAVDPVEQASLLDALQRIASVTS